MTIAKTLDDAAKAVKVDFIGGFSALVEKGFTTGDTALIEALPSALAETDRVCASVNVASTPAGINMDAVRLMERLLKQRRKRQQIVMVSAVQNSAFLPTFLRIFLLWQARTLAWANRMLSSMSASVGLVW